MRKWKWSLLSAAALLALTACADRQDPDDAVDEVDVDVEMQDGVNTGDTGMYQDTGMYRDTMYQDTLAPGGMGTGAGAAGQ